MNMISKLSLYRLKSHCPSAAALGESRAIYAAASYSTGSLWACLGRGLTWLSDCQQIGADF